jgi:hypothetical protein
MHKDVYGNGGTAPLFLTSAVDGQLHVSGLGGL